MMVSDLIRQTNERTLMTQMPTTPKRKKSKRGGPREGSGRPSVFSGDRVKVGVRMTSEAWTMVQAERARLEPEHHFAATDAAALESLVRAGYSKLHRKVR